VYSPLVGVVDVLQTDVLFVLEQSVKLGVMTVESELGEQERGVRFDKRPIALGPISADSTTTGLDPSSLLMCFFDSLALARLQVIKGNESLPPGDLLVAACAQQSNS